MRANITLLKGNLSLRHSLLRTYFALWLVSKTTFTQALQSDNFHMQMYICFLPHKSDKSHRDVFFLIFSSFLYCLYFYIVLFAFVFLICFIVSLFRGYFAHFLSLFLYFLALLDNGIFFKWLCVLLLLLLLLCGPGED